MRKTEQNSKPEGSPTTKPCTNSEMSGTAKEQLAAVHINTTDAVTAPRDTSIKAGPVPLYLIPQTISSEIHAHGGEISGITVRRTGQHVYAITLTKAAGQQQKQEKRKGTKQTGNTRPKPGRNACAEEAAGEPHAA